MDLRASREAAIDRAFDFLASPRGRNLRTALAAGAALGAPALFRMPILRRHPVIRALEVVGGAAAAVALAERFRDWEPPSRVRVG